MLANLKLIIFLFQERPFDLKNKETNKNTVFYKRTYISNINMKSEGKNAGVKEVLQIFTQVTGEHLSRRLF